MVNITCAKDKRDKAVEIWNRMVAGDKAVPENYDRLARLLGTREFRTDAIAASRKAVALAPGEYRYREALARRLMENKEYAAALSEYGQKHQKLAPNEFFVERSVRPTGLKFFGVKRVLAEQIEKSGSRLRKPLIERNYSPRCISSWGTQPMRWDP